MDLGRGLVKVGLLLSTSIIFTECVLAINQKNGQRLAWFEETLGI